MFIILQIQIVYYSSNTNCLLFIKYQLLVISQCLLFIKYQLLIIHQMPIVYYSPNTKYQIPITSLLFIINITW